MRPMGPTPPGPRSLESCGRQRLAHMGSCAHVPHGVMVYISQRHLRTCSRQAMAHARCAPGEVTPSGLSAPEAHEGAPGGGSRTDRDRAARASPGVLAGTLVDVCGMGRRLVPVCAQG